MINNLSLSSGPLVAFDIASLPQGADISKIHPWQIFQFNSTATQGSQPPIHFFQPNSHSAELLGIFDKFLQRASIITGIPPHLVMGQNERSAPTNSSKALSVQIANSSHGLKLFLSNLGEGVIKPLIKDLYFTKLLTNKDLKIYGDVNVEVHSFDNIGKEAARLEVAQNLLMLMKDPSVREVLGVDGLVGLIREIGKVGDFDVSGVIPTDEEVKKKIEQQLYQL
jgi:hypothetical protein